VQRSPCIEGCNFWGMGEDLRFAGKVIMEKVRRPLHFMAMDSRGPKCGAKGFIVIDMTIDAF
jgi:hypothetical protein